MAAPSANNKQPWRFVVVREPEKRKALSKVHKWSGMCAGAALVVVVLGDPEVLSFWVEDCSAATENLLLAATSLGLGGVWVAVSPNSFDEASVAFDPEHPGEIQGFLSGSPRLPGRNKAAAHPV